jgi:polyhydroxybutyrate depolymerase
MSNKGENKGGCFRKILLIIGGLFGFFLLSYASMWIASLIGRQSIIVDGMERKYRVHVPIDYDDSQTYPLLIALHMYSGTARTMQWTSLLNPAADENHFIVVYPEGYKFSWAEGSNEFAADQENIDDVAFISTLIDQLNSDYSITPGRIYAVGFSSGGLMVQRLGCELSGKIQGIATVGATLSNNMLEKCQPENPISVLMIHGTADQGVPYQGNGLYASVHETIHLWNNHNHCQAIAEETTLSDQFDDDTTVTRTSYTGCIDSQVALFTIEGGGHTWPGGSDAAQLWGLNGKISKEISASQIILTFFSGIQ